ncbi:MAG: nicotinamide-nucleotide amidohydrolase family protein, partial [Fidelibacterota bacterium]
EMKAMMEESVLPAVSELVSTGLRVTTLRTTGLMESALHEMVSDLVEASPAAVSFIPGFLGVDVRLTSRDENAVLELSSAILDRLGNHVYAEDWETLEEAVGRLLREEGLTLAVAESCTGGLLADRLTDVPGSSDYFLGGVVTYSDGAKVSMLGVKEDTLASTGAVSEETAREMARGVRELLQAHLGVAITGIAGPTGGTPGKPVGLTYIGLDYAGDCHVIRYIFSEDRRFNKELAAQAALNSIRLALI